MSHPMPISSLNIYTTLVQIVIYCHLKILSIMHISFLGSYPTFFLLWVLMNGMGTYGHISPRIVQTHYGALRGIIDRFGHGSPAGLHPVEKFLGVPYATPPIKGLRFMPPLTPSPWDGIKNADRLASSCPQQSAAPTHLGHQEKPKYWSRLDSGIPLTSFNEDCLYLNIFYPTIDGHLASMEKPPIVLIVEAINWQQSGANAIDPSVMATRGRLMVATVNFRLGILGFLKTSPKDNPQGNYGMLDVIAAIHWLRLNAAAFGGDSGRLTLVGIGHGAALVHLLMLSQMARGLFHGVILMGGSAFSPTAVQPYPEDIRQQVASLAGCWDATSDANAGRYDLAPCLRKFSIEEILVISNVTVPSFTTYFAPFVDGSISAATKDNQDFGAILRDISRMKAESNANYDLLVGLASYELEKGLSSYTGIKHMETTLSEAGRDLIFRTFVRNIYKYHNNEIFAVLRNEYTDWELGPKNNTVVVLQNLYEALSDGLVVSPLMELLRHHSGLGSGKTFLYHLDYPPPSAGMDVDDSYQLIPENFENEGLKGSFHEDGVSYLLGLPLNSKSFHKSVATREDIDISEQLLAYVAGFCYAGDPNEHGGSLKDDSSGIVFWEPYTLGEQRYLSLGLRSQIRSHYRSHKMSVWLRLIPQLHQPGEEGTLVNHQNTSKNLQGPARSHDVRSDSSSRSDEKGSNLENNFYETQSTKSLEKETSSECPSMPSYQDMATQPSTILNDYESNNETQSAGNKATFVPTFWINNVWSYTTMLAVTIATGFAFLVINLMVIACFCIMGRRPSRSHSHVKESLHPAVTCAGRSDIADTSLTLSAHKYDFATTERAKYLKQIMDGKIPTSDLTKEKENVGESNSASCERALFKRGSIGSIIDLTKMHPLLAQDVQQTYEITDPQLLQHALSHHVDPSFSFSNFLTSSVTNKSTDVIPDYHQPFCEQRRLRIPTKKKQDSQHEIAV